ncbi:hypothetical protein ABZ896_37840, partial [Streptomyces sp. NPDC047072]|uniref:hypothetical protein n=1 Tax=Streptomyces sp. NPDC047072 TaxID=3154809 RepID=UPI0033FDDBAC
MKWQEEEGSCEYGDGGAAGVRGYGDGGAVHLEGRWREVTAGPLGEGDPAVGRGCGAHGRGSPRSMLPLAARRRYPLAVFTVTLGAALAIGDKASWI